MIDEIQAVYVCQPNGEWTKFMGRSSLVPDAYPTAARPLEPM